jgi:hypothetical protein
MTNLTLETLSEAIASMSQALEKRGIAEQAEKYGWVVANSDYWGFPVRDRSGKVIAQRFKRQPDTGHTVAKYLWPDGKPESPDADWYILPPAQAAIDKADGVLYIVNGEPAVLTLMAASIDNVGSSTLSEISFPRNGVSYLLARNISHIHYVIDNDKAGYDSAIIWRDALRGSGIDFQAFTWGKQQEKRTETDKNGHTSEFVACGDIPDKADANDIWIALNFDKDAFAQRMANLSPLELPAPIEALPRKPIDIDFNEAYSKLAQDVFEAVSVKGFLTGKKFRSGFYQMNCPYHDDSNASAGIHPHTGVINCFVCGKHKIKKNALEFGVDFKSYMPKPEGRKRAKKADFQAFEAALEAIEVKRVIETRSYEDIMLEEMNLRAFLFEQKQFVGFGQWKHLPMGVLSAIMTFCKGRSSTALFLARLHEALVMGKLPTVFNREMAAVATRMPYNAVSGALFEAEPFSFISKLSGLLFSIDSIASKETMKNSEGRPCDWFIVELDSETITAKLAAMMDVYQRERQKKAIVIPSTHHAAQIGLSEAQYQTWHEKAKLALEDPVNKAAKAAIDLEMLGNGGSWKGWIKALENKWSIPLPYFEYENSLDLRAGILNYWVTCLNRHTNSREELARLLGCSDPVIDKVLERAKLKSIPQTLKVELNFNTKTASFTHEDETGREIIETETFQRPTTVKGMASALNRIMGERRGKVWKVSFLVHGETGWQVSDMQHYKRDFAAYNGRISRVFFMLTTPSKQVPMNAFDLQELAEKQAKEASEKAAKQANTATPSEDKATEKQAVEKASEKQSYEYTKWTQHSYGYSYAQLRNFVHSYTMHELKELKIVDKKGKELASGELEDLFQWALANAAAKPTRRMQSLLGKYEEESMVELEAFAAAQLKRLGLSEIVEFEDSVEDLPIFAEVPVQKSLDFVPIKPKAVVVSVPQGKYDDYLNNPYLGAWEKARREKDVQSWLAQEAI